MAWHRHRRVTPNWTLHHELVSMIPSRRPWQDDAFRRVAVMGPHPDDFDAVGVTMRRLRDSGAEIQLAVMTTGASGVDSIDYPDLDRAGKAALRESEQVASCAFFGLPPTHLHFLRLDDRPEQEMVPDAGTIERVADLLARWRPDLVVMPHPNDPNRAHQCTFEVVESALGAARLDPVRYLSWDPKTIGLRADVVVPFGAKDAAWKVFLLLHHESQQRRNLRTRGHGLDERILALNRFIAERVGEDELAEAFELRGGRTPSTGS